MNALLAQCYCNAIDSRLIEPCCVTRLHNGTTGRFYTTESQRHLYCGFQTDHTIRETFVPLRIKSEQQTTDVSE